MSMDSLSVTEALVRRLEAGGVEYAVLVGQEYSVMLKLAGGQPSVVQSWKGYRVGVYIAREGRILYSVLQARDPGEVVARALESLGKLRPSPLYAPLPEPTGESYEAVDSTLAEMAVTGDISRLVEDLELDQIGDAAGMVEVSLAERSLVASNGARLTGKTTEFTGYVRVIEGEEASGQWSWVSTAYDPVAAKKAIGVAKSLAEECRGLPREKIEPGKYRVLLSPMVAGNLLSTVMRSASAGSLVFGTSFFSKDQLGSEVASPKLTLLDAPHAGRLPGYSLFDDEGVATKDKHVIREGVLETFLHNSKTARLLGSETTGNAGLLLPRPFNMIVAPGTLGEDDMLDALGEGIYATNNWYTRFQNFPEGLFSTVTRDALFIVRRGKPVACAQRLRLTGSMKEMIRRIDDLGRTQWPIKWWEVTIPSLLPHVLVGELGVTSE